MSFQDRLKLELTLTLGGQSFTIPGGQLKHFAVRLSSHGFTASVTFWTALEADDAPLFTAFQKPDLLKVKLSISGVYPLPDPPPAALVVQGLARTRGLGGTPHGALDGSDRRFRRYTIEFADAAQVLWRQHRPIELNTDKTMADVLSAHTAGAIQLEHDWDVLDAQQPMLCLGVGENPPSASFYDFILWYTDTQGGYWTYDSQQDQYTLSQSKPAGAQAVKLPRSEVERVEVQVPPVIRHNVRVLNSFTDQTATDSVEQDQAATGIQHDVLLRTPIAADVDQRKALEQTRLRLRQQQLLLTFQQFPTVSIAPGVLVQLEGPLWNPALKSSGDDYRVIELVLTGDALNSSPQEGPQEVNAGYQVELTARLEQKSDPVPNFPPYREPLYPIYVEGKMHSPGGAATDRIYLTLEDKKTAVSTYQVTVPLWNKTVSVPAAPLHFPGEFYFPPYKNSRVLLALHLDRAEIHRYLDWGDTVRTAQDGQGDQLLLGKSTASQTAFTHDYQDNKPVWQLARVSANDTQTVRMSEGALLLQTKEVQGTTTTTPTYDVTPQVETAKGDLSAGVTGGIGEATAAYRTSSAAVNAKISSATSETAAALTAAEAEVNSQVATARGTLQGALSGLSGRTAPLSGAASAAKAKLKGLV
ncbi:hypothetical protein [Hyalangium minutum]|uniref:Uncharacterized protein n=1 Tax=Hyalangium minutum TaxID=394096 RepID=A0A085WCG9_9BACT|nr:hypothetical protein [Hyalangium minutum]KFE65382.1 hypothetical protein DB31_1498 [Hyalangium minutum]